MPNYMTFFPKNEQFSVKKSYNLTKNAKLYDFFSFWGDFSQKKNMYFAVFTQFICIFTGKIASFLVKKHLFLNKSHII